MTRGTSTIFSGYPFLFAIPVLEGLAMYLIPKMLGTRDLAFPATARGVTAATLNCR
ncbi:hypothetical protein G7328_004165 [Salmonella enterica]|nr:hypothetical protein [Salmonella enterica]